MLLIHSGIAVLRCVPATTQRRKALDPVPRILRLLNNLQSASVASAQMHGAGASQASAAEKHDLGPALLCCCPIRSLVPGMFQFCQGEGASFAGYSCWSRIIITGLSGHSSENHTSLRLNPGGNKPAATSNDGAHMDVSMIWGSVLWESLQ